MKPRLAAHEGEALWPRALRNPAPCCSCQGLFDNFLNMKLKDSSFGSVCLALEWLGFSDVVNRAILHSQNFQLLRYLPFLPVAFHLLFASSSIPRLAYPNSQHEASTRERGLHYEVGSP